MPSGNTTTAALNDSLPTVISSARITREYEGVMPQLVDKVTLGEGIGLSWNEVTYAQLTATATGETTEHNNPQQISDTLFTITPTGITIHTVITDKVADRITKNGFAKLGSLAQNAVQRMKDENGLTVLDGATISLCGAGTTMASGYVAAAAKRITSNATEPGNKPIRCVLHGYQIKDIYDELVAGVGTYVVSEGLTARVFSDGFNLPIAGCEIYEDGNITIDSSDDAKGGVFAKEAIVLVQGEGPQVVAIRNEKIGMGATEVIHRDEYAYGERSAGNWLYELYSDATAPTS